MKKISLIVMEREKELTLEKLREAGVVHLKKKNVSAGLPLDLYLRQIRNRQALGILAKYPVKKGVASSNEPDETGFVDQVLALNDEKELFKKQIAFLDEQIQKTGEWGDFDPEDLALLKEYDISLFLYRLSAQIYKRVENKSKFIIVSRDKQWVKALAVGEEIPGITPVTLPDRRLSEISGEIGTLSEGLENLETRLADMAHHKSFLEKENRLILEEIEYEAAKAGMETLQDIPEEMAITWLSGYVPGEKLDTLKSMAEENCWTLVWNDPAPEDLPPTLLRNNKVVRIIQPLFSMLGTLPGYRESDISCSYLVFLCIFFAMILGDAVYGIILFIAGLAIGVTVKKKGGDFPDMVKLLMLFSVCTVIWGAMNGSWSAIPASKLPEVLRMLIIPPMDNIGPLAAFPLFLQKIFVLPENVPAGNFKTQWNLQFLCFTIGMIQLVWARAKNFKMLLPSLTAIAQLGWLAVVIAMYFMVLFILLKVPLPFFVPWLIGAGIALNFIFSEQKTPVLGLGSFLKNIVKSLADFFSTFLKAIGCFGDIISYIRLFAVGMAGGIIVQTINSMAIPSDGFGGFGLGFVLKIFSMLVILVFAHTLNLAINALSVIVHGIRLNLLEYAGNHLEMGWFGYAYNPFALKRKK